MRARLLAVTALAIALLAGDAGAQEAATFLGFRLLNLEDQHVRWQTPSFGKSAVVTYALASERLDTPDARNCAAMLPPQMAYQPSSISTQQFREEVAAAFRMWEKAAGIQFRETHDTKSAEIIIGAQAVPIGRAFTNVALKPGADGKKIIGRSLICLNPKQPWKIGFDGRLDVYDLRYTIAHEIGHAIGLDHPSAAGQLMSYRYDEKHAGLQQGDIEGAVRLYGPSAVTEAYAVSDEDKGEASSVAEASRREPDRGWPFGIGMKRANPVSKPLEFRGSTGSIAPGP